MRLLWLYRFRKCRYYIIVYNILFLLIAIMSSTQSWRTYSSQRDEYVIINLTNKVKYKELVKLGTIAYKHHPNIIKKLFKDLLNNGEIKINHIESKHNNLIITFND